MKDAAVSKDAIVRAIQSTARENGGKALGWRRFEGATGIRYHDWYGKFWTRWNDAPSEAGLAQNRMSEAYDDDTLFRCLADVTRELNRVPTVGDLRMRARDRTGFPSDTVFRRLGFKSMWGQQVLGWCVANPGFEDVAELWRPFAAQPEAENGDAVNVNDRATVGFVYLLRHGSRREYKIGRTNDRLRRDGEIKLQLPEKITPVHTIETDDPAGVETYWHRRFADRRKEGEWFALSPEDVRAFKRWRKIF
jgi:Meiotically up-regulated gene 113